MAGDPRARVRWAAADRLELVTTALRPLAKPSWLNDVEEKPSALAEQVAWLMLKVDPSRSKYLTALTKPSPELAAIAHVAKSLFDLLRTRNPNAWTEWIEAAGRSPLASFAKRLERDKDAVLAALRLPWSNGMVEGQIHRLKLLKRQMYGRAGFHLLRERVLHSS